MSTTASDVENGPKKKNGDGTKTNEPSFWDNYGNQIISGGSTLLGSAIGAVGNIIANQQQKKMMQMQNEFNRSERIAAQDWELSMWNKQNEYNTPLAQKQRLLEAGFNPYNLGVEGGNASNMPSSSPASGANVPMQHVFDPSNAFTAFADNLYKDSLMRSQVNNLEAQTDKTNAETTAQLLDNKFFKDTYGLKVQAQQLGVEQIIKSNQNIDQQINESIERQGLIAAQKTYQLLSNDEKRLLNQYLEPQLQVNYLKANAELNNLYLQGELTKTEMKYKQALIVEAFASASKLNSEAESIKVLTDFNKKTLNGRVMVTNMANALESHKLKVGQHVYNTIGQFTDQYQAKSDFRKSKYDLYVNDRRNSSNHAWSEIAGETMKNLNPFLFYMR